MIGYIEHHITDHCNLNCAGCSHFSPIAEPWYESIEDFKHDFNILADKTGKHINTIRLMGGEPLLHPHVEQFAIITRELFPNSEIQVVTNGILLQKQKSLLVPIFNQYGIKVCVSNYGLNFDLKEILSGFNLTRIDGKAEMYHIGLTEREVSSEQAFRRCDLQTNRWYYFQQGRMWHCCISANIDKFDKYFHTNFNTDNIDNYSIQVENHSLDEIEYFLSQPIPLCKHCNVQHRLTNEHNFYISKKEISEWICQ